MSELVTYTPEEMEEIQKFLADPRLPDAFETYVKDWIGSRLGVAPFEQLIGIPNVIFHLADTVTTEESTTSASFVNLTTTGPTLTGLADGRWLFFWGCQMRESGGAEVIPQMGLEPSWALISNSHVAEGIIGANNREGAAYARAYDGIDGPAAKDSSGLGNNSVTAKYRRQSGTGTPNFSVRWLAAIRIGEA